MKKIEKLYAFDIFVTYERASMPQLNMGTYAIKCDHFPTNNEILKNIYNNSKDYLDKNYIFDNTKSVHTLTGLNLYNLLKVINAHTKEAIFFISVGGIRNAN